MTVKKEEQDKNALDLIAGFRHIFTSDKGLIAFLIFFEFAIIMFLGSFSDPIQQVFGGPLIPISLPLVDRVSRIIMLYHSLAVPFLAAIVIFVLSFFSIRPRFESQVRWSIMIGAVLTTIGGLTFAYLSPYNWIAHGIYIFGLSISFYAGILLLLGLFPTKNFPDPKLNEDGPYLFGLHLEHINLVLVAIAILVSTAIGAYVGANFGQAGLENGFLAEEIVRAEHHNLFERMVVSHLHIMIALLDAAIMLVVFRYSGLKGRWLKIGQIITIPGTIILAIGAWLVLPDFPSAHMVINVGAMFLLSAALILTIGGWNETIKGELGDSYSSTPFSGKIKALLREPVKLGMYFQFFWVNLVVTIPGIYVAFNLDTYRSYPLASEGGAFAGLEYAFNVGHWHVLATLTAIIVLFMAMDYFGIKKGRIRDSMAWLLIIGTIIAFLFATLYMLPVREGIEEMLFVVIDIGVAIMFAGITIFVVNHLYNIFFGSSNA
ncbi:MAG: hypothetical protein ACW981_06090 [Candidatus Hodarchaeales archaeon]